VFHDDATNDPLKRAIGHHSYHSVIPPPRRRCPAEEKDQEESTAAGMNDTIRKNR